MVTGRSSQPPAAHPLTRKEFYDLAAQCRVYATELAAFDPRRVNLKQCHKFNAWLRSLRRYERLSPRLKNVRAARPIARWQIAALSGVLWLILSFVLLGRGDRLLSLLLLNGAVLLFLAMWMVPERLFGTTIEEIEGHVLRVVHVLEEMLAEGDPPFSEAAWFQVKANLEAASLELRQQLDLAHRE